MVNKQDFHNKIDAIGQNFLLKLKESLPLIRKILETSSASEIKKEDQEKIAYQTHKIAGLAKIFGFEKIGNLAALIENNLKEKISDDALNILKQDLQIFLQEAEFAIKSKLSAKKKIPIIDENAGEKKHKYTIVIAEDDTEICDLVKQALSDINCKVVEAKDGNEAVRIVKSLAKDLSLVILDINMPKKNGFEVLELLKENSRTREIPVIMLTLRSDGADVVKGISFGAIDYITKPFEIDVLKSRVKEILQNFKEKILIADDDELIHEILSEHFRHLGYTVINAKDGKEALRMIKTQKPDIVIADYMMPALDGISLIKKVKSDKKISNTPIVILSVKSQQENILNGLKSGARDYITKPFDIEELSQRITSILQLIKNA